MEIRPSLAVLVLLSAALACGQPSPGPLSQADRDALRQAGADLQRAVVEGDWETVASHYVEDAFLAPPGAAPMEGRQAIRDHFAARMADVRAYERDPQTVQGTGELAYVRGNWTVTSVSGDSTTGAAADRRGSYLVVRRRQADGRWLIVEHIVVEAEGEPRSGGERGTSPDMEG